MDGRQFLFTGETIGYVQLLFVLNKKVTVERSPIRDQYAVIHSGVYIFISGKIFFIFTQFSANLIQIICW